MIHETLFIPADTALKQRRASDPAASAWVSANAGAGKTKVLTDRVVRLLLAGSPPGRILCLTFTKAAAANMAIRIFDRLGRWVTLDEDALAHELAELQGYPPSRDQLNLARRLFARAVETPGGLKIDTLHAFCERLLHLVPFEAGVPARFTVLDENRGRELVAEATASVLADAAGEARPDLGRAYAAVAAEASGDGLTAALDEALRAKAFLRSVPDQARLDRAMGRLARALGLEAGESTAAIEAEMLEGGLEPAAWPALADALERGKATDQRQAELFRAAHHAEVGQTRFEFYRSIFFTAEDAPRAESGLCTKAVGPEVRGRLVAEQARLIPLMDRHRAARAAGRSAALFTLASEVHRRVEAAKARLGALDFDDLIHRTLALFNRGDAAWALYKLDRGIDHVLLDEAQDTNPDQWAILRHLTEDFTSGEGARGDRLRTLFAVGDPKQSIYSFQGADPRDFERSRRHWVQRAAEARLRFEDVGLDLSFRSGRTVLGAVDATFRIAAHHRGLSFEAGIIGTHHRTARREAPGLVELWPVERPVEEPEPDAWRAPLDLVEPHSPPVMVAHRVAHAIRTWTTTGDETGRVWRPGEVLVLVRQRGPAFDAVIRALKEAHVPVAGQDRLRVGEHIAVMDLVAAGRAALLPADDLTLASALKSPLVGLTDDDLTRVAAGRPEPETLAEALRRHAARGDAAAQRAAAALDLWRQLAAAHGPFGFYATLLGPEGGRRAVVSRLGAEAGDAIDAFLCFAHEAELTEVPSLATFLARFESASHEVKRDLDAARDEVRVMTVHGAKGLEAGLVVLLDGCHVRGNDPALLRLGRGDEALPVWSGGARGDCARVGAARDAHQARGLEEHHRLLYVAMTRARDRLVIAPYRTGAGEGHPEEAWCEMVRRALAAEMGGLVHHEAPYGPVDLWRHEDDVARSVAQAETAATAGVDVPDWLTAPLAPEPDQAVPLAATLIGRVASGLTGAEARRRALLVQGLLERLPNVEPARRPAAAEAYLVASAPSLAVGERGRLVARTLAVLDHPGLGPLFGPNSRADMAVTGNVTMPDGEARPVLGRISRLGVAEAVIVADYRGDPPPAEGEFAPLPALAQLALHRELAGQLHPGLPVRACLIWTADPRVEMPESEALDRALAGLVDGWGPRLDPPRPRSYLGRIEGGRSRRA